jgi:pimeloyl-ACP methyl ester carboxylesterase
MPLFCGRFLGLVLACAGLVGCIANAQLPQPVTPSIILPDGPAPRAKLSQWKAAEGRSQLTLTLGDTILRGYLYAGADPKAPTVIFFNGSGEIIAESDELYRKLAKCGPSVAVYDYAGWGFSTGRPDVMDFRADSLKIYDQVAEQSAGHHAIAYGYSMGTAVAAYVASQRSAAGLVLAAPIANAREFLTFLGEQMKMGGAQLALLRISPEATEAFGEAALLSKYMGPLLVIHGSADTVIPFAQGREVFAACPSAKKYFIQIKGSDHYGLPLQPGALSSFTRFVALQEQPAT